MDLKECSDIGGNRHPWELARLSAVRRILSVELFDGIRVLDQGCGDGFVARTLFSAVKNKSITAVDINLSENQLASLCGRGDGVQYLSANPSGEFDLILLLDVLEHVAEERGFLGSLVGGSLASGGKILITVPAFDFLYSDHDSSLGHYRRYTLPRLKEVAAACGLTVTCSGYLFFSLLLPKMLLFKLLPRRGAGHGVGRWRFGKVVTSIVRTALDLDSCLLLTAAKLGLKLPGLSAWALCAKAKGRGRPAADHR